MWGEEGEVEGGQRTGWFQEKQIIGEGFIITEGQSKIVQQEIGITGQLQYYWAFQFQKLDRNENVRVESWQIDNNWIG